MLSSDLLLRVSFSSQGAPQLPSRERRNNYVSKIQASQYQSDSSSSDVSRKSLSSSQQQTPRRNLLLSLPIGLVLSSPSLLLPFTSKAEEIVSTESASEPASVRSEPNADTPISPDPVLLSPEPEAALSEPAATAETATLEPPKPRAAAKADIFETLPYGTLDDIVNACTFKYPLAAELGGAPFTWVETRKPERYSSAAPLTPDARLRIVSERLDYKSNVVITVSIVPPNYSIIPFGIDSSAWEATDVAKSVLADRFSPRVTNAQRREETSVIGKTIKRVIDGETYWYYEYVNQKSPTVTKYLDVFRHSLAVSAAREGYIYTFNVSALEPQFEKYKRVLKASVDSFRLTPPTGEYVAPWKDPWRFW